MELKNFGHTQSLERFEYKGQEYLLLTGTCSKNDKDFATEIICVKYVQGGEVNAKNCGKIKNLAYSNINKTNFGTIDRMDIGLQGTSKIVIWKRRTGNMDVQVSTITFSDKMKKKLAKGNVMNFNSYEDINKSYRLTTFTMNRNTKNYILPESMQSIDMEAGNNIYISSGRQPGIPLCIAQVGAVKGKYKTKYKLKFKNDFPIKGDDKEIEGVHCKGDELWFLIANSEKINVEENGENVKLKRQFICSINK